MLKRILILLLTLALTGTLFVCSAQTTTPTNARDASQPQVTTPESQPEPWLQAKDLAEGTMCLRKLNEAEQNVVDVLCGNTKYGKEAAMFPFHVREDCTTVKIWSEIYQDGTLACKDYPTELELGGRSGEIGVVIRSGGSVKTSMCIHQAYRATSSFRDLKVASPDWDGWYYSDSCAIGEHPIELGVPYNLMAYVENEEQIKFGALSTYGEGENGMENFAFMILVRCEFD